MSTREEKHAAEQAKRLESFREPLPPPRCKLRRRKPKGPDPKAPLIVPEFHNVGHRPVGSIAYALAPYRKYFSRRPAQEIAIEAAQRVGMKYPILGEIIKCWYLLPKRDRQKVLALDYVVEAYSMPIKEFIAIVRAVIQTELLDQASDIQYAALPELMDASIKRAMKGGDSANIVKEAMAHFQQHRLLPVAPNAPTVNVQTNVGGPTVQVATLPSAETFAKSLDEAVRAGREVQALPPADMEGAIEAEVVVEKENVPT